MKKSRVREEGDEEEEAARSMFEEQKAARLFCVIQGECD